MALIKCKNCGREISDKAQVCPGCGYQILNDTYQDEKKDEVQNEANKKPRKNKILVSVAIVFVVLVVLVVLIALGTRRKKASKLGKQVKYDTVVVDENQNEEKEKTEMDAEKIEISWDDGTAPTEVGGGETVAKILDTKVVDSSFGTLLVMSFEYTNNSANASNFINDENCSVKPFQNGVALDIPGYTSEEGVYDSNDAYAAVKNGGVIKSQLAWILKDKVSPIEIEFGNDEYYTPDFIKTINLSGGTNEEEKSTEDEDAKSDYTITWENEAPEKIGNENEQAIIKNVAVVDSANCGRVLVIDIDFINNLEESRNLINNTACTITVYQNGVALELPGVTADIGYFNCNEAFTSVKKGGKISTQLAWSLKDDSPVEIEFGLDENENVQYLSSFTFAK